MHTSNYEASLFQFAIVKSRNLKRGNEHKPEGEDETKKKKSLPEFQESLVLLIAYHQCTLLHVHQEVPIVC